MAEFLYQAVAPSGEIVRGIMHASSRGEARRRTRDLCERERMRLRSLQRKGTYSYKVQRGREEPIRGEMAAFSREEAELLLRKGNYRVLSVRRRLLSLQVKPPVQDIVLFIRMCADMLREQLEFGEVLSILAKDTSNSVLRQALQQIQRDLRDGKDGKEVYGPHEAIFGRFATYMLSVASTSGNMAEVYDSTARFMERDQEFRRSIRSALIIPIATMVVLFGAVIYYVGFIFPATAKLFLRFGVELKDQAPMTYATLQVSNYLQANYLWLVPASVAPLVAAVAFFRTDRGRYLRDRYLIRLPVIGPLLHKTSIEIFARVFYSLYSGAGQNIPVIRTAAEACRNGYMERRIKEIAIPQMLREGAGLVEALEDTGVFTETAISRLRTGQESGALRATARQLADYYEKETSYKLKNTVQFVDLTISFVIMVLMVGLTLVSAETAVISPKHPLMR